MIRRFLQRVFSGHGAKSRGPVVIPLSEHGISAPRISKCALKVVSGLQEAGYAAFVVGGAVRDLLIDLEPKDYDVATNATPEQVKAVFRRSRIIGRRFRLVHVMCGQEIVEVSTFRGGGDGGTQEGQMRDEHGRILRDNVFGTQTEDALRRDFTINALFYDPRTEEVWDYCGGFGDLRKRTIRMIGKPEERYREDPVRMLRAVRLAAKVGGHIDPATREPIRALAELIQNVPPARVLEEMLKLLLSGHATECLLQLRNEGLHHGVLPMLDVILEQPMGERFVMLALNRTDERVREGKGVSPAFLFAALLWHEVLAAWRSREEAGQRTIPALHEAMDEVIAAQIEKLAIPRRFTTDMKELWELQARLLNRSGKRPYRMLEHPRLRAAYDFLQLRAESGEVDVEIAQWWDRFMRAGEDERAAMLLPESRSPKRRRRRRRPVRQADEVEAQAEGMPEQVESASNRVG
ncbi:MAG TPA: polynucleotide adenylyltransferase PcnB [Burkholderiales bacterium]|nr:polynucleotide adenylyltransferase PcnB [Burkholderiales bacterium]